MSALSGLCVAGIILWLVVLYALARISGSADRHLEGK